MSESKYERDPAVPPVKIDTIGSLRRKARRGQFDELSDLLPPQRTAIERWDIEFSF
ncbi:MAG: hypothetical protein V4737_01780 [Curtobacterium sp.]